MATAEELQNQISSLMEALEASVPFDPLKQAQEWHAKASVDYFGLFMFEYLAFISMINLVRYPAEGVHRKDRHIIQLLKQDELVHLSYIQIVATNPKVSECWSLLQRELGNLGLKGDAVWWNNPTNRPNRAQTNERGNITGLTDWANMVEILYQIRNNLFHGGKSLTSDRDQILVEQGYQALRMLVAILIEIQSNILEY